MLVSGNGAERCSGLLVPLGADVEVVDGPPGAANSRKLLQSVVYKGLAAVIVEGLEGARAAGLEDWFRDHIAAELLDAATVDRMVTGTHAHAKRRAEEMAAAADQLRDLGVEPRVTLATRDLLREIDRDRL